MSNLTPDKWDREGWLALCEDHLPLYYSECTDVYSYEEEIVVDGDILVCDHSNCEEVAAYELYPNLLNVLQNINYNELVSIDK